MDSAAALRGLHYHRVSQCWKSTVLEKVIDIVRKHVIFQYLESSVYMISNKRS